MTRAQFAPRPLAALAFSVCAALAVTSGLAFGDQSNVPSASALVEALKSKGATRGLGGGNAATADLIKSLKDKSSRGLSISQDERTRLSEAVKTMPNYDMDIPFDLNSSDISNRAQPTIEQLGKALQNADLKGANFLVAGHTDSSGTAEYNQKLSEQRAQSVRQALIKEFNLSESQLLVVGYGPEQPKDPKAPFAPENRRVQIVNLGE
jgi:outer membrane protein OmpA-like peptidoglycan-associated protein